ncbi:MAG: hypothetical protein AB1646_12740 [Thermodesulfobacteriota bacterium]
MKPEHHSRTMEVAADLIDYWSSASPSLPAWLPLQKVKSLVAKAGTKLMARWVAQIDALDDVELSSGLLDFLAGWVSKPTCFQHFAYCGYWGDELWKGKAVIKKYGGYCWDCDQYQRWLEGRAAENWMNVKYNPDCNVLTPAILKGSPGAKQIPGNIDWDDQVYPSALELAEFYSKAAKKMTPPQQQLNWDIQSLCFGVHLLQDQGIPHHVLCTVAGGHSHFEEDMYGFWRSYYSERSNTTKDEVIGHQLSDRVANLLGDQRLSNAKSFEKIGEWAVDRTGQWLQKAGGIPAIPCAMDSLNLTVQGIACTIRALALHA